MIGPRQDVPISADNHEGDKRPFEDWTTVGMLNVFHANRSDSREVRPREGDPRAAAASRQAYLGG